MIQGSPEDGEAPRTRSKRQEALSPWGGGRVTKLVSLAPQALVFVPDVRGWLLVRGLVTSFLQPHSSLPFPDEYH